VIQLRAPIIINESSTPLKPGCINVFSSVQAAEQYLEAWYAKESYFACDLDGLVLEIGGDPESGIAWIVEKSGEPARPDLAEAFLRSFIEGLIMQGLLPESENLASWLQSATVAKMAEVSLQYAINVHG